ncbi:hypothetical protein [Microbacterium sp. CR_7]|uniref:hypothetical protein n=1 Tax=Microbacterium sp. CR_7 TaxID=3055792 RepID=UPI0035C19918
MSEPEPTPSLIQQRFALHRERNSALWMIVSPLVAASVFVAFIVDGRGGWFPWLALAAFVIGAVYAVWRLFAARRAIREFEDRYGRDAGIQD